jgi:hypothetical protein
MKIGQFKLDAIIPKLTDGFCANGLKGIKGNSKASTKSTIKAIKAIFNDFFEGIPLIYLNEYINISKVRLLRFLQKPVCSLFL